MDQTAKQDVSMNGGALMLEEHGKVTLCKAALPLQSFWYHLQASLPADFWPLLLPDPRQPNWSHVACSSAASVETRMAIAPCWLI